MAAAAKLVPGAAQPSSGAGGDPAPAKTSPSSTRSGAGFARSGVAAAAGPATLGQQRTADRRLRRAGPGRAAGLYRDPFATGVQNPRRLLVLANGDVLVAQQGQGQVTRLHDGGGQAGSGERYAGGFNEPYGLAWRGGELIVADQDGIWRVPSQARGPSRSRARACSGPIAATTTGRSRSTREPGRCSPGSGQWAISRSSRSRKRRSSISRRTARTRQAMPPAPATLRRWRFIRKPANCGRGCRNATDSATICRPTI